MLVMKLLLATLASLVAGSAIPKDATLAERQATTGLFCQTATNTSPREYDIMLAGVDLTKESTEWCIAGPWTSKCDTLIIRGSAALRACVIVKTDGESACFNSSDLYKWYARIARECPGTDPTGSFSRVQGAYILTPEELPSNMRWAQFDVYNPGPPADPEDLASTVAA